jgi:hypothetical protein
MPQSVLDAIRKGQWDFEPDFKSWNRNFLCTLALPGTQEKVDALAQRAQLGLPLWHPEDRKTYDDSFSGME